MRPLPSFMLPLALLGGCARADADGTGATATTPVCFWPSQVSGFSDAGPTKAVVRVGNVRFWELTLSPGCPQVDYALQIGIRSRGGQAICPGRPAELFVPEVSGTSSRRCLVRSVRPLSPEEAAAVQGRPTPGR